MIRTWGWVQTRIEELRRDESDAQARIDRIQNELGRLGDERQWGITQARKKTITDEDMEQQLATLTAQENEPKRELMDKSLLVGNRAEQLLEFVNQYRANLRGKLDWLNSEPQTPEEGERQFKARRQIVEAIVKRVNVYTDKTVKVVFEFDLTGMDEQIKERRRW